MIHTLNPSLENRFSRRGWATKRRRVTMWYWLHVVWFDRDRCFQLWSCDSAPYLLPSESLGAWVCESCTLYDLLPPRLRTSSNAPSSRRLKLSEIFTYIIIERFCEFISHYDWYTSPYIWFIAPWLLMRNFFFFLSPVNLDNFTIDFIQPIKDALQLLLHRKRDAIHFIFFVLYFSSNVQ